MFPVRVKNFFFLFFGVPFLSSPSRLKTKRNDRTAKVNGRLRRDKATDRIAIQEMPLFQEARRDLGESTGKGSGGLRPRAQFKT